MHRAHSLMLSIAGAVALAGVGQAHPTISTDAAPGVNFSAYRTYNWVAAMPPGGVNPVMYQQILAGFDSALASRGYQKAAAGDLTVALTLGEQQKTDVESWGRFGLQTSVYQYTQGQLSFDVFDTKTRQALWHGQATETFDPDKPNPAKVNDAVSRLMQAFPATAAPAAPPPAPKR